MSAAFRLPDFSSADLELRFENGIVCIYGTEAGLSQLIKRCQSLVEHPGMGHIHLEREGCPPPLLTAESEVGAVAIFDRTTRF